jgi:hypothetical protein
MPNVNILYNATSGRILSSNLAAIAPIPAGHAITLKSVAEFTSLFDKRIDPVSLALVDKDYLKVGSATTLDIATVATTVFTKQNGETDQLEDDVDDNETVLVSARLEDHSFDESRRKAFFKVLSTALFMGAGQVRVATGLAPGKEMLVFFHDTLRPAFQVFDYV